MTSFTVSDLHAMGFTVEDGKAVRAAAVLTVGPRQLSQPVKLPGRYKSQWEVLYAQRLGTLAIQGVIEWWGYEAIKLRLADGAWYTPDFAVRINGRLEVREIKGWWREAARVRVKVAAENFPWLPIHIVKYVSGQFRTIEVFNG